MTISRRSVVAWLRLFGRAFVVGFVLPNAGRVATSAALAWVAVGGCVDLPEGGTLGFGVEVPEDWGDFEPAWSPDGSEIAVSSTWPDGGFDSDIQLMDLQGQRLLLPDGLFGGSPSWSPDALSLAFSNGSLSIHIVSRDGSVMSELPTGIQALGPVAWSPGGETIAFTSAGGSVESHIYLADVTTSEVTRLTQPGSDNEHLSWSPDGTQAVFRRFADPGGESGIYRIDADGSNAVQLLATTIGRDPLLDPAWSPCGAQIAFAAHDQGRLAIHLMDSDGSNRSVLTDELGNDRSPAWSPDCSQIAFSSDRAGNLSDIWIVDADGSGLRRLTIRE